MKRLVNSCLLLLATSGCNGTTGSGLTSFKALLGGPPGVVAGAPLTFTSLAGYDIALTEARFHVAAVYLNQTVPTSGGSAEPCILPGVYVDEVFGGVDVDLLSPTMVPFPTAGDGTLNEAVTGEVWLSGGDINATDDETPILQVGGTATQGALSWPFSGLVTIGTNHTSPPANVAMPGANPICRQRIVSPIDLRDPTTRVGLTIADGGTLTVRVNPANLFNGVDFSKLAAAGSPTTLTIPDDSSTVGEELFNGVRATTGLPMPGKPDLRVYQFDVSNP